MGGGGWGVVAVEGLGLKRLESLSNADFVKLGIGFRAWDSGLRF